MLHSQPHVYKLLHIESTVLEKQWLAMNIQSEVYEAFCIASTSTLKGWRHESRLCISTGTSSGNQDDRQPF